MNDSEMLDRLLKLFTYSNYDRRGENKGEVLQFLYKEGVGVWDIDPELELALLERRRSAK
jgi:hypothetical protein